jgi:hypothetical protein
MSAKSTVACTANPVGGVKVRKQFNTGYVLTPAPGCDRQTTVPEAVVNVVVPPSQGTSVVGVAGEKVTLAVTPAATPAALELKATYKKRLDEVTAVGGVPKGPAALVSKVPFGPLPS